MKKLLYLLLFIILPFAVISQNIKGGDLRIKKKSRLIGQVTIGSRSFDNSAILTLTATDRGLLIPRLTTAERDAISSPTAGLMVYNTTDNKFQYYDAGWLDVGVGVADSSFITLQVDTVKAFNNTNIQFADSVFFQNPVQINSPFTVNLAQSTFKGIGITNSTSSLLVQNSASVSMLEIRDNGTTIFNTPFGDMFFQLNGTNYAQFDATFGGQGGVLQMYATDGTTVRAQIGGNTGGIFESGIRLQKNGVTQGGIFVTGTQGGNLLLLDEAGTSTVVNFNPQPSGGDEDYINTGRNFGIGLITPSEKLEVNGNIKCDTLFSDAINIFSVSDTILTAAVLTLNSSPVTIVAAPGAGKVIEVISATFQIIFNSAAYVTNTTLRVITATAQSQQVLESQLLLSTGSRIVRGAISGSGVGTTDTQLVVNQALTIDVATGNPETGDSKFVYYITYRIITL